MKKQLTAIVTGILLFLFSYGAAFPVFAEGYSFKDAPTAANIGESVLFTVTDGTEILDSSDFKWSVSPSEAAIVKNGSVTFLQAGNVRVKAEGVSGTAEATVSVSRTPHTEDGMLSYNFTTALSMNRFDANFVPDNTGVGAGNEDWENHWSLNTDMGYTERINDFSSDVSENVATLYLKNTKMDYFDVTIVYQNVTGASGWIGVVSNNNDLTKRGIDSGLASFVQSDGKPTFWGPLVGSAVREVAYPGTYVASAWHVMRVRMTQGLVEMYIDDLTTPAHSYPLTGTPEKGNIGIMASGTGFRISHVRAAYLKSNGEKIEYRKVDSLEVLQKPETAAVGQTIALETKILPENATVRTYTLTSSNSNICIAKNGKLVFIAEGTVTVSVVSDDNPSLAQEWQISVGRDPEQGEPGSGSYYVDEGPGAAGITADTAVILTIVFSAITLCGAAVAVVLLLVKKR